MLIITSVVFICEFNDVFTPDYDWPAIYLL